MLDQLDCDFVDSKSGQIYLYAGTYTPYLGWIQCETGRTNPFRRWRAFFNFDTSALPDHSQIEAVFFRVMRRGDAMGEPETYALKFSLGTFIGAALDGNVGEWDGGTHLLTLDAKPATKTTLDLSDDGGDPCALVNKAGDTDLKVWDDSYQGSGDLNWETNFNESTTARCKLFVQYSVPSGTATGRGFATLSATVTHHAGATATGTGDAALAAGLLLATASATASGVGSGELAAIVIHFAGGTASGTGTATLVAVMIYDAAATATGVASATLAAALIYSAGGTATGIGTATLGAIFYVPPLALDERTISVASYDAASISIVARDSATIAVAPDAATISVVVRDSTTIAVDPDDVATRGPRRANR